MRHKPHRQGIGSSRILLVLLAIIIVLIGGGWWLHHWYFPYGSSHCCDLCLWFALEDYAEKHDGKYPTGEETPEASLSLLYPDYVDAEILRGKTVPRDVVQGTLDRGDKLGPDTCGWHYVEGLTNRDSSELALFWDKAGLGHNGQRLRAGGRFVVFVRSGRRYIPESEWPAFVEEQERLLIARGTKPAKKNDDNQ